MKTTRWWILGLWLVVGMMILAGGETERFADQGDDRPVREATFEGEVATLTVVFRDGSTVVFRQVREEQFEQLIRSRNRAAYLYREILSECPMEFVSR
jgi:hypothetical protein